MARIARIVVLGYPHHIMQRGNRRQETFFCDDDYRGKLGTGIDILSFVNISIPVPSHLPNHSHYVRKREFKWDMLANISKKYDVPLLCVNQVGGNDSVLFDGMSIAFDSTGQVAARARDFEEDIVVFDTETQKGELRPVTGTDAESVLKALIMGTRDYVQKCGFITKVMVGLSGGIDSALTACIAVQALGRENVMGIFCLPNIPLTTTLKTPNPWHSIWELNLFMPRL